MAFHFFFIFVLLNSALGGSHGTITKEEHYWISIFPHTTMPKVLKQILPTPGLISDKGIDSSGTDFLNFDHYTAFGYSDKQVNGAGTDFLDFHHYTGFSGYSDKEPKAEDIHPTENVNRKGLRGKSSHENTHIKETVFFVQENLTSGTEVNLPRLLRKSNMAAFLPQQIAKSMPLSNQNLSQILKHFSLKAESKGAYHVKVIVNKCERSAIKGETKYCATSLESFLDSAVSVLGSHIQLLSHELGKDVKEPFFTIGQGVQKMGDNDLICHKLKFPYAVYMCHSIEKTEVYKVPLVNKDEIKTKALAVCHKDTSTWSPNHIAFKLLDVKPGTVSICHFLGRDTLVWIAY